MPARHEFETEFENEAEQSIKDIEFHEDDTELEVKLKLCLLDNYNLILDRREERKKFIFSNDFLEFKKVGYVSFCWANLTV